MLEYKFLKQRGALQEGQAVDDAAPPLHLLNQVAADVFGQVPEKVARDHNVMPLYFDGETLVLASATPDNIALCDKLRFLLAKDVRLVAAPHLAILQAINNYYATDQLAHSTLAGTWSAPAKPPSPPAAAPRGRSIGRYLAKGIVEFKKGVKAIEDEESFADHDLAFGCHDSSSYRGDGMFFYTVDEGQRVLMRRRDGTMEILIGPKRVWRGWKSFEPMEQHIAYPGTFLIVRYRTGQQKHVPGPAVLWLDPREHAEIVRQEALQLATKEAVVVYSKPEGSDTIRRRIVHGPALFVPEPGEWLHTFSWHASKGGSQGATKQPNALVFQKLWLMPDQMYHDVYDVRTADDAVLSIRLMIFFELIDIERMLDTTHDPIGDFTNAATSDVVAFIGQHDFESFKQHTGKLNELETYGQLSSRASQCGYRINKVVYRGYGAAEALQQMHDQAIQARTKLQLERATEQQAQDLENYKLDCQLARAGKRRTEQTAEVVHDLELAHKRQEAELQERAAVDSYQREGLRLQSELEQTMRRTQDAAQRDHLAALREMGVDLTAYLTQARADRVIELRGAGGTHVHLDPPLLRDGVREEGARTS